MSKTRWMILGSSLAALALGCWGWANRRRFYVSDITTGESATYPELRSRVYYADAASAMTAASQALRRLPRWNLLLRDEENDVLEAEVKAPINPFAADVTVYFFPLGRGQTRVTIRSRSRRGGGDLGRNAAHIRALQEAMDDRLNAGTAF